MKKPRPLLHGRGSDYSGREFFRAERLETVPGRTAATGLAGSPRAPDQAGGMAVFSLDALSLIAYATEEILSSSFLISVSI